MYIVNPAFMREQITASNWLASKKKHSFYGGNPLPPYTDEFCQHAEKLKCIKMLKLSLRFHSVIKVATVTKKNE